MEKEGKARKNGKKRKIRKVFVKQFIPIWNTGSTGIISFDVVIQPTSFAPFASDFNSQGNKG